MTQVDEAPKRSGRINLRVDEETDRLLRCAASIEHKSLSAFLVEAGSERARRTVDAYRRLELAEREFHRILDELDKPAEVIDPLLHLAKREAKQG